MATPKMVDVRELNPQQLTEVAQRYEQELQVLQGCHQELLAVRKKFITSREAVVESKDTAGEKLMVPLTGSLYVAGRFSDDEKRKAIEELFRRLGINIRFGISMIKIYQSLSTLEQTSTSKKRATKRLNFSTES